MKSKPDPLSPNTRPGKWPHGQPPIGVLLAAAFIVALAALGQQSPKPVPQGAPQSEKWLAFEGDLSAAGTRQTLPLAQGRIALIFHVSGSLLMTSQEGLDRGFRCEVVGFDDGAGLSVGSCVWTDERGDKIFSDIKGDSVAKGKRITGTVTGGTGRYAGLSGEYAFVWQYVVQGEEGTFQGRAVGLKGRVRRGPPPSAGSVKP